MRIAAIAKRFESHWTYLEKSQHNEKLDKTCKLKRKLKSSSAKTENTTIFTLIQNTTEKIEMVNNNK